VDNFMAEIQWFRKRVCRFKPIDSFKLNPKKGAKAAVVNDGVQQKWRSR
jgi:hypothetical protein